MSELFDTNILIDHLNGEVKATKTLRAAKAPAISIVTWMEVLVGAVDDAEEQLLRSFLSTFDIVPLTPSVADQAVAVRRRKRLKLPDAIILASAQTTNRRLVTRNIHDFGNPSRDIKVPYRI